MDPVSIIIMLLGFAVLGALYYMSRTAKSGQVKKQDTKIHAIREEDGRLATSVRDDTGSKSVVSEASPKPIQETQLILFIAANNEDGLNGNKLINIMEKIGLQFGDMGLYHRITMTDRGQVSVYTVANGVEPWTLKPDEIREQNTPGVSLILNLPSKIDDVEAINDFVEVAQIMARELKATLKNQNQEEFSDTDKQAMLALVT